MSQYRYPGVGRLAYVLLYLGLFLLTAITFFLYFRFGMTTPRFESADQFGAWMHWTVLIANLALFLVATMLSVLRLRNLGMSGWWFLVKYVPILNLWVFWRLFVCPAGYADHKQLDLAGKIIATLLVILFGLPLLALIVEAIANGMAG